MTQPLGVFLPSLAFKVPVSTDATLTAQGTALSPLHVSSATVATDGTTITGNGTTLPPLAINVPLTLSASLGGSQVLEVKNTFKEATVDLAQGSPNWPERRRG